MVLSTTTALLRLALLGGPIAWGLQVSSEGALGTEKGELEMESEMQSAKDRFVKAELALESAEAAMLEKDRRMEKIAEEIGDLTAQMEKEARSDVISPWPKMVPPRDLTEGRPLRPVAPRRASLLSFDRSMSHAEIAARSKRFKKTRSRFWRSRRTKEFTDFQPSREFQSEGEQGGLPWGIGAPRTGDSLPIYQYSAMPANIDQPAEVEYSLQAGDNIQTFASAEQDVKLLTQVLFNVTNGFFLDTNAGDGEKDSNTLLLELVGWRGLCLEPRTYHFAHLWGKFRKAWLFLGALSPHENATKVGFDKEGNIDELSGHKIHAYPLWSFMQEMGGRKTIDFWNLHSGGYEAEILQETLFGKSKFLEIGVIMVQFDGRRTGRGYQDWVQHRSKDETEELVFEILHNASYKYIGGLDAYWINHVEPRYHYKDAVFVLPSYFQKRSLPVPWTVKAAPPPELTYPLSNQSWDGFKTWDSGYPKDTEIDIVMDYIQNSIKDAQVNEPVAKAHRVAAGKLLS